MDRPAIASLWKVHSQTEWPRFSSRNEGQLMTLDTVIGGCAVYYLDNETELEPQRISILEDCIVDLDTLLDELTEDCRPYFERARQLARLLIDTQSAV